MGESLFDAVRHVPVELRGKSQKGGCPDFSRAKFVVSHGGFYDTRNEMLANLDTSSWLRTLVVNLTYGGGPFHRLPE